MILGNPVTLLWMSVVSGYLVSAIGYQWMFIIEGLPAVLWAFIFRALIDDRPRDADWLGDDERGAVVAQLETEQEGLPPSRSLREVMSSRNVIVLSAQYLLWSVGVYGLVFWLPSIIRALTTHGIGTTGALSAIPYAVAVVTMIVASAASDRLERRVIFVWPFLLVAAACFAGSYFVRGGSFIVSFILLAVAAGAMYAPYGPYLAHIPEILSAADAAPATGMINAFGGLGGFVGVYVVGLLGGAGSPIPFAFLAACLVAGAVLMFALRHPGDGVPVPATRSG